MGETLKLLPNVPEVIALAFADGMPVASKFGGDQILFTLDDERRFYAAPFLAAKIKAAGIRANQPFTICKREIVQGNRRVVEYQIETGTAATAPVSQSTQQTVQVSQSHSIHAVPAPVAVAPAFVPSASGFPIAPAPLAAAPADTSSSAIAFAGRAAVDAMLAVESYAQSKGMTDFCFGADNLQRLWVTLYIDARKGGRA